MLFVNRQKEIEARLASYRDKATYCVQEFQRSFAAYCASGDLDQLAGNVQKVHKAESEADDLRREIEVMMYSRALFPESRGDVLGLLETLDAVPNQAEMSLRVIQNHFVKIPESLHPRLFELVRVSCRCADVMFETVDKLFADFANTISLIGKIDELESQVDGIEAGLLQQIFSSDLGDLEKILLRDLVNAIALISDRAEDVADRVRIIVSKRMV